MELYIRLPRLISDHYAGGIGTTPMSKSLIDLYKAILSCTISYVYHVWQDTETLDASFQLQKNVAAVQSMKEKFDSSFDQQGLRSRLLHAVGRSKEVQGMPDPGADRYAEGKKASLERKQTSQEAKTTPGETLPLYEQVRVQRLLGRVLGYPTPAPRRLDKQPASDVQTHMRITLQSLYDLVSSTSEYQAFIDWHAKTGCRVLWVHGSPGPGKSMVLDAAVQSLSRPKNGRNDPIGPKVVYSLHEKDYSNQEIALSVVAGLVCQVMLVVIGHWYGPTYQ